MPVISVSSNEKYTDSLYNLSEEQQASVDDLVNKIKNHELSIFDEAEAISQVIISCGITQETAAEILGRAQSTIANKLRLLRLTDIERDLITQHCLSERHARSLVRIANQVDRIRMLENVLANRLNVDATEREVSKLLASDSRLRHNSDSTGTQNSTSETDRIAQKFMYRLIECGVCTKFSINSSNEINIACS